MLKALLQTACPYHPLIVTLVQLFSLKFSPINLCGLQTVRIIWIMDISLAFDRRKGWSNKAFWIDALQVFSKMICSNQSTRRQRYNEFPLAFWWAQRLIRQSSYLSHQCFEQGLILFISAEYWLVGCLVIIDAACLQVAHLLT